MLRILSLRRDARLRCVSHHGKSFTTLPPWSSAACGIERAHTPPAEWYCSNEAHRVDKHAVFAQTWQAAQVAPLAADSFQAGRLHSSGLEYLLTQQGAEPSGLQAFHNVCRHHSAVVASGCGSVDAGCRFVCPYHGWTYDVNGRLVKATKLQGIQGFSARDHGLVHMQVDRWLHHFTMLRADCDGGDDFSKWLGPGCTELLESNGVADTSLRLVHSRKYENIQCNWKVFVDNYLDGGYHVPHAHPALAQNISMSGYHNVMYDKASVQVCQADPAVSDKRLTSATPGRSVVYAFLFPSTMVNRYGPWMDVNIVYPTSANTCTVDFHWWLEEGVAAQCGDDFVQESLAASDTVQQEDIALCESVQRGAESPGFRPGRYAPQLEAPMYHFHQLLHAQYERAAALR